MPEQITPIFVSPISTRFTGREEASLARSFIRFSTTTWRPLAMPGIITHLEMSF